MNVTGVPTAKTEALAGDVMATTGATLLTVTVVVPEPEPPSLSVTVTVTV